MRSFLWVNNIPLCICTLLFFIIHQLLYYSLLFINFFIYSSVNGHLGCFWIFEPGACGILAPPSGMEAASPTAEGEVFTSGPAGKSLPCPQTLHPASHCSSPLTALSMHACHPGHAQLVTAHPGILHKVLLHSLSRVRLFATP